MVQRLFNIYCKGCTTLTESISKILIRIIQPWNMVETMACLLKTSSTKSRFYATAMALQKDKHGSNHQISTISQGNMHTQEYHALTSFRGESSELSRFTSALNINFMILDMFNILQLLTLHHLNF